MNIKQRHFIQKSQIRDLKNEILKQYDANFLSQVIPEKAQIEYIETELGDVLYAINNELKLWKSSEGFVPVLTLLLSNKIKLKKVIVDMGAIRFVANGADIMRPGITKIDSSIKKGDIIDIVDETHNRSLAVGKALYDAREMEAKKSGKVVKNLHTIQDAVWKFEKSFS
jgi:PUA-domain protein